MTLPAHLKTAITRFDAAAQNFAFRGSAPVENRPAITHQYETAREKLERAIEKAILK